MSEPTEQPTQHLNEENEHNKTSKRTLTDSTSDASRNGLFKRVKNYVILGMLILIFVNTAIVSIKTHVFDGDSMRSVLSATDSIDLAHKLLSQFSPHLGAIQSAPKSFANLSATT